MDRWAVAQECAEIEARGGDVLGFLRGKGCISPWGTWHRLQVEELGRKESQITDGKESKKMGVKPILTEADHKEAVRIALEGGDPREYLGKLGIAYPSSSWQKIKLKVKITDPETYEKLPKRLGGVKPITTNAKKAAKRAQEAQEVKAEETHVQTAEAPAEAKEAPKPAIYAPLNYMGFNVTTIEDPEIGAFHYDRRHGFIDWTGPDGVECASLEVEVARKIYHAAPTIFGILGVAIDGD